MTFAAEDQHPANVIGSHNNRTQLLFTDNNYVSPKKGQCLNSSQQLSSVTLTLLLRLRQQFQKAHEGIYGVSRLVRSGLSHFLWGFAGGTVGVFVIIVKNNP